MIASAMMGVAFHALLRGRWDEVQPLTECQNGFLGGRGFPVKVTLTGADMVLV